MLSLWEGKDVVRGLWYQREPAARNERDGRSMG